MTIPTYDQFIEPVLRYLATCPEGAVAKDAHEAAATALGLTNEERQEMLPSGVQAVYKNRAGWAHDRLKRAGLSKSPKRGYWRLTDEGMKFIQERPSQLSKEEIEKIAVGYMGVRLSDTKNTRDIACVNDNQPMSVGSESVSPDERLETAISEIRESVATEILEMLAGVSPTYFETIVLDVLHKLGYGASRSDLQRVGGVSDGGIDGVISLDKLGLEKVYVQAKRWQSSVGRPEIQAFYGALAGQKANKGVFITTSSFTSQASEFASSVERIVLVDGVRLAQFMMDHEVGVSLRSLKIPKIDTDYFEE
ncbi:MAG: restriction endonuclease [Gammaproteobacteria bacterium]|nr:restriction endonuclease [Gammaproteobacteria bacterium]